MILVLTHAPLALRFSKDERRYDPFSVSALPRPARLKRCSYGQERG